MTHMTSNFMMPLSSLELSVADGFGCFPLALVKLPNQ